MHRLVSQAATSAVLISLANLATGPRAVAQTAIAVPTGNSYESSGGAMGVYPVSAGSPGVRVMQVIDRAAVGFANRTIQELAWRHSAFYAQSWTSVQSVRIAMGYTQLQPDGLPTQFAQIPSGTMTDVFVGNVTIPSSATPMEVPRPWSLRVPLQTPWRYDASVGNLVIEYEASMVSGAAWWLADVHTRTTGGAGFQIFGPGCGGLSSQLATPSVGAQIVPGGSATFHLNRFSRGNLSGGAYLGLPTAGYPLDLGSLGAPGCLLQAPLGLVQPASLRSSLHNATGSVTWSIPLIPGLSGIRLDHQAIMNAPGNAAGAIVSTSHRLQVGSAQAAVPVATNMLRAGFGQSSGTLPDDPTGWILRLTTQ